MFQRSYFQQVIKRIEEPRKFIGVEVLLVGSDGLPWQELLQINLTGLF